MIWKLLNGLNNLIKLDLSSNQSTELKENIFSNLSLGSNYITEIHSNLLNDLTNLMYSYLDWNSITKIHSNTFKGLKNLKKY